MSIRFDNIESDIGLGKSDCYGVISRYEGDMNTLQLWVSIYATKAAMEAGHRPMAVETLTIAVSSLAKSNIFAYLYSNVLDNPAFAAFNPAIIELPYEEIPTIVDPEVGTP